MAEQAFETWGILEIMGHCRFAGRISEQQVAGAWLVRIDVPECDGQPAFSKLFGVGSIYSITPTSEEVARRAVRSFRSRPMDVSSLLPAPRRDHLEDGGPDDGELF